MYRKALAIAHQFTFPVVLSRRMLNGACGSGMGSFVVINSDGWIVTAAHIFNEIDVCLQQVKQVQQHAQDEAAIRADQSLNAKARGAKLHALGKLPQTSTASCSAWWGADNVAVKDVKILPEVDLGIGRLEPFDPAMVAAYPLFKDPKQGVQQGAGLVKLGYPFHAITPIWDDATQAFSFPNGAMPPPSFPIEGILTRLIDVPSRQTYPFPLMWMETSSPGLRGQSGGPTVDEQGVIWAIQSNTVHLQLGFNPPVPGAPGQVEHQFLNVGRGIHVGTILGFLDSHGVKYDVSAY